MPAWRSLWFIGPQFRGVFSGVLKVLISLLALGIIATKTDFGLFASHLHQLKLLTIVLCVTVLMLEVSLLAGLRLNILLNAVKARRPLPTTIQVAICGSFFEQVALGFVGGDAMRVLLLRRYDVPGTQTIAAIAGDRVLGLGALLGLAVFGLPGLRQILPAVGNRLLLVSGIALLCLTAGAIILVLLTTKSRIDHLSLLARRVGRIASDRRLQIQLLAVFALALATHLLNVLVLYLLGRDLRFGLGILDWLLIAPPSLLMSMLPISSGGWGIREATLVIALSSFGIPPDMAVVPSIAFGLSLLPATLPGAFVWWLSRGRPSSAAEALRATPVDLLNPTRSRFPW